MITTSVWPIGRDREERREHEDRAYGEGRGIARNEHGTDDMQQDGDQKRAGDAAIAGGEPGAVELHRDVLLAEKRS
jgi:hypothetical protein